MSTDPTVKEAARQLQEAAAARKCWPCGCLHHSLQAIEQAVPETQRPLVLATAMREARARLTEGRYDCLGCEVCYPALAVNALNQRGDEHAVDAAACPRERVEERPGWPPLPGSYTVLRYQAPVAVCTLTDDGLATAIAREAGPEVSLVGTLQTENLGIERLIANVLANPNMRFLIVCGADSRQVIGHLPGQSLVALARNGLDDRSCILGARGKRPVLRNVASNAVEHFRQTVEVVHLVGNTAVPTIMDAMSECADRNPGQAEAFAPERMVVPVAGYLPTRMISDPAGYFVVYVDRPRRLLSLEHYLKDGVLDTVIEGRVAGELYTPATEKGLVSRLDHAAYLGRELARAERALLTGEPYVQDAAPEYSAPTPADCGCAPSCGDASP